MNTESFPKPCTNDESVSARLLAIVWERRPGEFVAVLTLMLLAGIAEFAAVAATLPFLSLLMGASGGEPAAAAASWIERIGAVFRMKTLVAAALFFALCIAAAGLTRLVLAARSQRFVFRLGSDIAVEVHRRVLHQPYVYHVGQNSSDVIASLEKTQILIHSVLLQLMYSTNAAVVSFFLIGALLWIDPMAALAAGTALAALYALVAALVRKRLLLNSKITASMLGERIRIVQESLGGIRDIIVDSSQPAYVSVFEGIERRLAETRANTALTAAAPRFIVETIGMILIAGLAILLFEGEGDAAEALPVLGAFALGAQRLLPLAQQLYTGLAAALGNRTVAEQVLAFLALPCPPAGNGSRPDPLPLEREIAIRRVTFSYPSRALPALHEVDFAVPAGACLALVGETGSGKSSLLDLVMGLVEPTSGGIEIDGTPLDAATRARWWRSIAHVPQSIFLADASIARNIAFGLPAGEVDIGRVTEAARRAQLHDFILSLPESYETVVGERGVRLSGGQRQRVGIARALYKRASVLILDEATNALDEETEAAVLEALHDPSRGPVTVILVTHRPSALVNCDLVARLEGGRLTAFGPFLQIPVQTA